MQLDKAHERGLPATKSGEDPSWLNSFNRLNKRVNDTTTAETDVVDGQLSTQPQSRVLLFDYLLVCLVSLLEQQPRVSILLHPASPACKTNKTITFYQLTVTYV